MRNTFSFYATKTGEFYSLVEYTDEHSVIARVFGLRDTETAFYAENLAKAEFTPPEDTKLWQDLSKWGLKMDEIETPAWFDHEKARGYMERLIRPMFVTDARKWLVGGCWIFDGEKASAKGVMRGRIVGVINGACLAGANLAGANLAGANLAGANLDGACLAGAYLARANLARAYLAGAIGLAAEWVSNGTMLDGSARNPLTAAERQRLAAHMAANGHRRAAQLLGLSRGALYRAIAGRPVQPGSVVLVRAALALHPEEPRP